MDILCKSSLQRVLTVQLMTSHPSELRTTSVHRPDGTYQLIRSPRWSWMWTVQHLLRLACKKSILCFFASLKFRTAPLKFQNIQGFRCRFAETPPSVVPDPGAGSFRWLGALVRVRFTSHIPVQVRHSNRPIAVIHEAEH